ncbi:CDP-alcohol phosphatidyltransferase family protein [Actinomarinicola tropica]|uniref:CDP-alcohol phosphatidyltransferase family protein n=1 Tax=Actinomarinicola tropica TaxID=2789776 RepID=UPI00189A24C9|nr:CDP-alcohol phosphatidyltransferase family protein [Actinomarinicola tropica]
MTEPADDALHPAPSAADPLDEDRVLTVPNLISVVRLLCVPLFLWLLFAQEDRLAAAVLLAVLGATDWVDGYIARRFHQVSTVGKVLDPTADRIMLLVGVVSIAVDGSVPWWLGVLTLVREGAVSLAALGMAALGARRIDVTWWGKTGTFLLMFSYPLFLSSHADWALADPARVAAWVCGIPGVAISYYSAAGYVPAARAALRTGRDGRHRHLDV